MESILNNTTLIASIATAAVIGLVFFAGYQILTERAKVRKMKDKINGKSMYLAQSEPKKKKGASIFRLFQSLGKSMAPKVPDEYTKMRVQFYKAGIRHMKAPHIYYGAKIFFAASFLVGFIMLKMLFFITISFQLTFFLASLVLFIGFYIPGIWLKITTKKRQRVIFEGFPDALDLVVTCVESGMGLDAAIARTGKEMQISNAPISEEFNLMNLEMRAGKTREEAFNNLALRADTEDIKAFVTLLIQTDKFGTNIAQALRVFSETFRIKRYQRAEEMAAKLPIKLLLPLVLFIFPSLFVVVLGPAAIQICNALKQVLK